MFAELVTEVAAVEVGDLPRHDLTRLAADVGRAKAAMDGLLDRIALATDALGDGGPDGAGVVAGKAKESTRSARARVRKARTLKKMPNTAARVKRGEITATTAAQLARAADDTSAAAVDGDDELLDRVASVPDDQAGQAIAKWTDKRDTESPEDRIERQRRRREVRYLSPMRKDELKGFIGHFDDLTHESVEAAIEARVRSMRCHDERAHAQDPSIPIRGLHHLRADAVAELLTGRHAPVAGRPDTTAPDDGTTSEPGDTTVVTSPRNVPRPSPRASMIVLHDLATGSTTLPSGAALPDWVADQLGCTADIFTALRGPSGLVLDVGRAHRRPTHAQWVALVTRDRGCVICGVAPQHCHAHHNHTHWTHRGPTDLDNLVLVCGSHHQHLHANNLELHRDENGRWRTAPYRHPLGPRRKP